MPTVQEIAERIAKEGMTEPKTQAWPRRSERPAPTSWKPNRKIVSAVVAGAVAVGTAYLAEHQGITLDTEGVATVTAALMAAVGYLVPEKTP